LSDALEGLARAKSSLKCQPCTRFHPKKEKPPGPLVTGGIPIRRVNLPLRIKRMMPYALEGRKFGAASGNLIVNGTALWVGSRASVF